MARKGWEEMVEKYVVLVGEKYPSRMIPDTNAVILLARQHAGFVRRVKKERAYYADKMSQAGCKGERLACDYFAGAVRACDDLLAALGTRKKGK